jgi:hypothetical protein
MPTIWNDRARENLLARFARLEAGAQPRWGKFTAGKMVKHCADGIRMAMGDLAVQRKASPLEWPLVKHVVIFVAPWPQGAPTAPELIPERDLSLPVAMAELKSALLRLRGAERLRPHPAFGKLSHFSWGWLIHKHLDHHLRQFGV